MSHAWKDAPTRTLDVNGVPFAYREVGPEGPEGGVPVVFLHHLMAVFPSSGHGGVFQYHREFVSQSLAFLAGNETDLQ